MESQLVDGFVRSRIPLLLCATALSLLAASISPARDAIWLLPYIDSSGVTAVITFLWWARTVSCVYAVLLLLVVSLPVRAVRAIADDALQLAGYFSPRIARRLELEEFARKYRVAQRGQQ
ncbi:MULTISPECIES: hypothetical protein [Ralstonia]|uniref:hypothetical protein n=1 Tax=Ralstonia TaxID=48736 RepID=UPI0001E69A15|nr:MULTISPECIES: hypothetical protein [Ralstonia]EFP68195.1 hypothetical protein HMPREF1004_00016 [Ralstonia pickettii]EGY63636.1 hypothetical protein HMPREF0989_02905 [Ralstonia sp. 5_2_56FAA]